MEISRTTVEYLIKLLETDHFQNNQIDTGWLDKLIVEKVQVRVSVRMCVVLDKLMAHSHTGRMIQIPVLRRGPVLKMGTVPHLGIGISAVQCEYFLWYKCSHRSIWRETAILIVIQTCIRFRVCEYSVTDGLCFERVITGNRFCGFNSDESSFIMVLF